MREITLEELLEAGCHFGHQVTRQNPKARDFIYEARDNVHIIDLVKTKEGLEQAAAYIKDLAQKGGTLVVVGTKRQAQSIVANAVKKAREATPNGQDTGIYVVTTRWMGGTLTNFSEVAKNYKKLKDVASMLQNDEEKAKYTKKELGLFEKDRAKLENFYGGIMEIKRIPDALFIIDTHLEELPVREAMRTSVKTVGIVDTNADPTVIDYPIPANDDAVGSVQFIVDYIIDAWIEGRKEQGTKEPTETKQAPKKEEVVTPKKKTTAAKNKKETKKEATSDGKPRKTPLERKKKTEENSETPVSE